jgi:ribosomal-protein-alanine N-acetyltransferase
LRHDAGVTVTPEALSFPNFAGKHGHDAVFSPQDAVAHFMPSGGADHSVHYKLGRLSEADADAISMWRYEPPYDVYNVLAGDARLMTDPAQRFSAVRRNGELIAYLCLGAEARVFGLGEESGMEDLGFGLRPDLMGQGLSREILPLLLEVLGEQLTGTRLRVVILDWNARSLAAYRRVGFTDVGSHINDDGTYLLLERARP